MNLELSKTARHYGMVMGITATICGLFGCNRGGSSVAQPAEFRATVDEVFYIKPPVDRVILVATISRGRVRPGDALVVATRSGPIEVTVEGLESIQSGDVKEANAPQQIGLKLRGITKDQPNRGDEIHRK